jgi:uncharacterized membrane protein
MATGLCSNAMWSFLIGLRLKQHEIGHKENKQVRRSYRCLRACRRETLFLEAKMMFLVALLLLLLLVGIIGGVVVTKFLFLVLIVAALLAVIGFFTRRTA